jgi:YidC/Oxa1 family membrane protein insertase
MKFYQEEKVNPFASCLPLVAQIPFFIGLFYLLQTDLRTEICGSAGADPPPCGSSGLATGAEQFLFIPDLTANATGWVLAVLIVLYIGSQLLSSVLTPSGGDRNMRILMYGLPFIFTPIIISFPAGLIVYWITTNLWTVGQGYILRRKLGPIVPPKPAGKEGDAEEGGGMLSKIGAGQTPKRAPVGAAAKSGATGAPAAAAAKSGATGGPPPRPPRKKKKRSGRRR